MKSRINTASDVLEISDAIFKLKRQKNGIIMAHYYQDGVVQDVADYIGDSLGLAQSGERSEAEIIVLAGVRFMAETAKILNPQKKVLIPDLDAGCSLADSCSAHRYSDFIARYPDHVKVTYVNCSVEVKALSDILCTSANALRVINSIPYEQPILFGPDKNLGAYLMAKTGRKMVLWDGCCDLHDSFDGAHILKLKEQHPQALVLVHPECKKSVLDLADFVGSTTDMLKFTKERGESFIVVTEAGVLHQMRKSSPEKTFIALPAGGETDGAVCAEMRKCSLDKILTSLQEEVFEVTIPEELRKQALIPLKRMLELG